VPSMEGVRPTQSKRNRSRSRDPASISLTIKEQAVHHKSGVLIRVDSFKNKYFLPMRACIRQKREDT
jgi:hypothetical protein